MSFAAMVTHLLSLLLVPLVLGVHKTYKYTNEYSRPTLVMAAISPQHPTLGKHYDVILNFQIALAKKIIGTKQDNVIIIADSDVADELHKHLPVDVVLIWEHSIGDPRIRDFAPVKAGLQARFTFKPQWPDTKQPNENLAERIFQLLYEECRDNLMIDSSASPIVTVGSNIVDNDDKYVVMSEQVVKDNWRLFEYEKEFRDELKTRLNVTDIAFLPDLREHQYQADKAVAFLSRQKLVITSTLWQMEREDSLKELKHRMSDVTLYTIEEYLHRSGASICGLHTPMITTTKNLYVPVYSRDPKNVAVGCTRDWDKQSIEALRNVSGKAVVLIDVPHEICMLGISPRQLTWHLRHSLAACLIDLTSVRAHMYMDDINEEPLQQQLTPPKTAGVRTNKHEEL